MTRRVHWVSTSTVSDGGRSVWPARLHTPHRPSYSNYINRIDFPDAENESNPPTNVPGLAEPQTGIAARWVSEIACGSNVVYPTMLLLRPLRRTVNDNEDGLKGGGAALTIL